MVYCTHLQSEQKSATMRKSLIFPENNLRDMVNRLNDYFFYKNPVEIKTIAWSDKVWISKWGYYEYKHKRIVINKVLKTAPTFVTASVVYHEMLHQAVPPYVKNGRCFAHGPEFRRKERLFPQYNESQKWKKENSPRNRSKGPDVFKGYRVGESVSVLSSRLSCVTIERFEPRNYKYPVIATTPRGQRYKFSLSQISKAKKTTPIKNKKVKKKEIAPEKRKTKNMVSRFREFKIGQQFSIGTIIRFSPQNLSSQITVEIDGKIKSYCYKGFKTALKSI